MVVDHSIAAHFQGIRVSVSRKILEVQPLALSPPFQRPACRNPPQQRYLRDYRLGTPLLLHIPRRQFQRPALVEPALQVVLCLHHPDVLVYRGQRPKFQSARDLLKARAVAIFVHKIGDEIQHLFLPLRQCHRNSLALLWANKKGKSSEIAVTGPIHEKAALQPEWAARRLIKASLASFRTTTSGRPERFAEDPRW